MVGLVAGEEALGSVGAFGQNVNIKKPIMLAISPTFRAGIPF